MAKLEIYTLGGSRFLLDGIAFEGFSTRKVEALAIYLAASERPQPREFLADLLWDERSQAQAMTNLRVALSNLRKNLGPYFNITRNSASLNLEAGVWIDAGELDSLLVEGLAHAAGSDQTSKDSVERIEAAIALYQGEFLQGFHVRGARGFEDWVTVERERLHQLTIEGLQKVVDWYLEHENYPRGIAQARRWLQLDPFAEAAHQQLIRLLAYNGQPGAALNQYQECLRLLEKELGLPPSDETIALYEAIQEGGLEPSLRPGGSHTPTNNLPLQLTSFIGRESEIAQLKSLLAEPNSRLVTLTGPGGIGKTRLALQVTAELAADYPDGVWLVELAPLSDPELIAQRLASTLGVREELDWQLLTTLTNYLREKNLLLVLDGCEHLIEWCAQIAKTLLHACPGLQILATSREALSLGGERVWHVQPLSVPDWRSLPPFKSLRHYETVQLFVDRAMTVLPTFRLTSQNAPAVAQVCQRLDGLPLAIELAASRVDMLQVKKIADRLDDRFSLLTGGSHAALPRHQTLEASIAWSYDLLSDAERALLRRLSVFVGGWTLEAAEAIGVGGEVKQGAVLDLQTQLVKKSLIVALRRPGQETHYHLLDTIREFALARLTTSEAEETTVRRRHANFYLNLMEKAAPTRTGVEAGAWLKRAEPEYDNFLAAFNWALENDAEMGLQIVGALWWFWKHLGLYSEGRKWFDKAATLAESSAQTEERALAFYTAAFLARAQGDYTAARLWNEESVAIWRVLEGGQGLGHSLAHLGRIALAQGDLGAARHYLEETMEIFQKLGDKYGMGKSLTWLGSLAGAQGNGVLARSRYNEGATMFREAGEKAWLSVPLCYLGYVACRQGDYAAARSFFEESFTIWREVQDPWSVAWGLEGLAGLAGAQGQPEQAARLFGAAEILYEISGIHPDTYDRVDYDHHVAAVRAQLGEEAFAAAWVEGQAMTMEQAIVYALTAVLVKMGVDEDVVSTPRSV